MRKSQLTRARGAGPCCMGVKDRAWVRSLFFLTLLFALAAVLGYLAYTILDDQERGLALAQFDNTADRAFQLVEKNVLRKRTGCVMMASVFSFDFPNASSWPYVAARNFATMSRSIEEMTSSDIDLGFSPLVKPDQLDSFEEFAYKHFQSNFNKETRVGMSSFGKGIFGIDPTLNTTDHRYRDDGKTRNFDSPNTILAPLLQHSDGVTTFLMHNKHDNPVSGKAIDDIMKCSEEDAIVGLNETKPECGVITDFVNMGVDNISGELRASEPAAYIFQPIYPANNNSQLTGIISMRIIWSSALKDIFPDSTNGILCVIETMTRALTFEVNENKLTFIGEGDLHTQYTQWGKTITITGNPGIFGDASAVYNLTLYPTDDYFNHYSTDNPLIAMGGAIGIIFLTSIFFLLYDFFVRKEFINKRSEAKRKFVRFVSHEVRTPLNSVCIGLQVMQEKLQGLFSAKNREVFVKEGKREDLSISNDDALHDLMGLSKEILTHTKSAVDILDDFLNYDKVEMGTLKLELSLIPIWSLVEDTINEFKLPAKTRKIDLTLDFSRLLTGDDLESALSSNVDSIGLPDSVQERRVVGDTIRIIQVLRNLVSNALKFTREGGKVNLKASWLMPNERRPSTAVVRRRSSNDSCGSRGFGRRRGRKETFKLNSGDEISLEHSGYVQVTVTDTGVGLSTDQLKELFGDGVQFNVNKMQAGQGSGLGLHIAKGIVEQHGGALTASSGGIGKGAEFTMTLPLYHVPDEMLPEATSSAEFYFRPKMQRKLSVSTRGDSSKSFGTDSKQLRILVVDDVAANRKLLVRLLENRGHSCDQAKDGQEAVEKVIESIDEEEPYDTVLLDYEMPVMDGPTAVKEMRSVGFDSVVVGITGNVLPDDIEYFKSCGANNVLPKPLQLEKLEAIWIYFGVIGRKPQINRESKRRRSKRSSSAVLRGEDRGGRQITSSTKESISTESKETKAAPLW